MSKKILLIISIISLVLCALLTLIVILNRVDSPNPTVENTTAQTLTVEYVKRVNSVATYIGVKEYNYELVVYSDLVSNSAALLNLSEGDTIFVRKYTENSAGQVWALSANGVDIVSLEDSFKYVDETNKKILPFGIGFSGLFAIAFVVCFCGYKGVFSKSKV